MLNFSLFAFAIGGEILNLLWQSGPVAKVVLLILLVFSLLSWSIILSKWSVFRRARVQSGRFLRAYRKTQRLQDIAAVAEQFQSSPLVPVFQGGYEELRKQGKLSGVQRACAIATSEELTRFERRMPWLATTGAVTPFIGLFGTVWGIIDAFRGIGTTGNASLATVAIPISEALVATAIGLVAAIPALMAYNFFQGQLKQWQTELDDYALEFISLSERNFT
jgi:biopolymer transport protein TolQ